MMTNKMYDILKWVALVVLPALAALYLGLSGVWGLPYGEEVSTTLMLLNTFLGAILQVSTIQYRKRGDSENGL